MDASNKSSQTKFSIAVVAYVPLVGMLYIFLFQKDDELALYHAKQALLLTAAVILTPPLWIVVSWLLMLIPWVGPLLAASSFALVLLIYVFLFFVWMVGIRYTLQKKLNPLPLIGLKRNLPADMAGT